MSWNTRKRGTTQEKITILEPYPDIMLWRFKLCTLGAREWDVVMWVKDSTWFMLCSKVCLRYTYKLKMNMEEFTLKLRVSPRRKTRLLSFLRCNSYSLMPYLLSDNDTCHNIVEPWFLWLLELRYALGDLELKFMLKHNFYIAETEETRLKRANSRANSKWVSLGRVAQLFQNTLTRPVVLQCHYGLSFAEFFEDYALLHSKDPYANVLNILKRKASDKYFYHLARHDTWEYENAYVIFG